MFGNMWNFGVQMVDAFIPGVGKTTIPIEDISEAKASTPGLLLSKYKSIKEIRKEFSTPAIKPVFILSSNKNWRKRVARILYGTENEDYFLD